MFYRNSNVLFYVGCRMMCALYTYYEAFVFINKSKMLLAGHKLKRVHKNQRERPQALKYINIKHFKASDGWLHR